MCSNGGNFTQDESALAVRSGQGLLTGLLRCGRCGRMHIRYWRKSGTAARYVCGGDFATGGQYCLGFGEATVDKRLSQEILKAVSPHGLNASLAAIERLSRQGSDQRAALQRQIQQVQYEAQRAFDQYNQVDPANRMVVQVLEQRWNDKLEALERLRRKMYGYIDNGLAVSRSGLDYLSIYQAYHYCYSPLRYLYERNWKNKIGRIKRAFAG